MKLFVEYGLIPNCFIPQRGDIVLVDFTEGAKGTEIKGKRPCIVLNDIKLSENTYHAIVVPITSNTKKCSISHIGLPTEMKTYGICQTEQVRSIDLKARQAKYLETASEEFTNLVANTVTTLMKSLIKV